MEVEEEGIVETSGSVKLVRSDRESRWVDGSEVGSESPSRSFLEENGGRDGYASTRRRFSKKPRTVDSFDVEAMEISGYHGHNGKDVSGWRTIALAFQTLGVVYGNMGTSPLYVFADVFSKVPITSEVDVLGALSLVMYTIALLPFVKYIFIVLRANDNGEGGTFALYSLICRYANINPLPNHQQADERISNFRLKLPTPELERALNIKESLEKRTSLKTLLLLLVLTGTSMIIGDGILTPALSVMSAVSGLQGEISGFGTNIIVIVSVIILVGLFSIQHFGTSKVGFIFAPALALWFFCLGFIGIYNILKHDITVVRAFNPVYIYLFFKKNSSRTWSALGGCVLCITGVEAMFADLGHFSVRSIQIAFTFVVFPCLLLAYMGQAAYLIKYPNSAERIFYDCIPDGFFWPVFVIATLAAMIASQSMISATFSCIKQSMALGCFPRLKVIHTSKRLMGQIYIPIMNWFLMIMCIVVVATFQSTTDIANAYGIAEVGVMVVSTTLVTLVMLLVWKTNLFLALCFPLVFGTIELIYLSAVLTKMKDGGWVPFAFATCFLCVMYTWNYGSVLKYQSEVREKISMDFLLELGSTLGTVRVPGIGLLYNELVQGIPSISAKESSTKVPGLGKKDLSLSLPLICFFCRGEDMQRTQDQRSRSSKPITIHACSQSGDFAGLQKLLRDNSSLLNERNPVMAQTPLHVSAGYNRVEIVKFLLDWRGPEKIELEAKNMYGETPLHMAAKNGCNEAAKLLLACGAFVEAKANNGMTPLHLAVWYSLRAEDCSTVKTLLEHNADCSAKDDEGMTPLNHLSQGPGSEKLREMLHWHLEEQRKHRAIEACSQTKAKMDELENAISSVVGLHELKVQLRKWARGMLLDERRRALGLKVGTRRPPHMAFLGNPGTGKTMVARVLGRLLYMVGILPTDRVTEVQRTDLVGEFVGHTGPKTRRKIKEAEGGILFVDEAYRLIPMQKADDKDYGLEALEEIMSVMDSGKVVVIFAGYSEPMKRVISSNEGFCRRVTKFFYFNDFSCEELAQILQLKMNNQQEDSLLYGFKLHSSCSVDAIGTLIKQGTTEKQRKEMNGGLVDPMLINARENLDLRLSFDCIDTDELLTITLEDLEAGLELLSQ